MNNKINMWWKLAIVSLVFDIIACPFWIFIKLGNIPDKYLVGFPHYLLLIFYWLLMVPFAYLAIFTLWHWRTRYAGKNHLAWPILAVITFWPDFISPISASFIIAVAYFFVHILPDIRGKGLYANPPFIVIQPPASPLPKKYQLAKSACFVIGWAFVVYGVVIGFVSCISHFVCWNYMEISIPKLVGKLFTEDTSSALLLASQVGKTVVITNLVCVVLAAIGAVLIQVSQKMRWRLLDAQGKEDLKEAFEKNPPDDKIPAKFRGDMGMTL